MVVSVTIEDLRKELRILREGILSDVRQELKTNGDAEWNQSTADNAPKLFDAATSDDVETMAVETMALSPELKLTNRISSCPVTVPPATPDYSNWLLPPPPNVPVFLDSSDGQTHVERTSAATTVHRHSTDSHDHVTTVLETQKHHTNALAVKLNRANTRKNLSTRRRSQGLYKVSRQLTDSLQRDSGSKALVKSLTSSNGSFGLSFNDVCDICVAMAILANGALFGAQIETMASQDPPTDKVPAFFAFAELVFCVIFTVELCLRLYQFRLVFFYMEGWMWNWFDFGLVVMQIFDVIMEYLLLGTSLNVSFLRILRTLRLLRVLRMFRLLHFLGDLNVVSSAIVNSTRAFGGALLMLLLFNYIWGAGFCLASTTYRIALAEDSDDTSSEQEIKYWWGNLGRSILSLFESILGGCDWDDALVPLIAMHPGLGLLFVCYVTFVLLAMMNVITGIFVDSAIKQAEKMKDQNFTNHVRTMYERAGANKDGSIEREDFEACMSDPMTSLYMENLGIEPDDANTLYEFLRNGDEGRAIDSEQFFTGLARLRAGARFMDIMLIMEELNGQRVAFAEALQGVHFAMAKVSAKGSSPTHREIGSTRVSSKSSGVKLRKRPFYNANAPTYVSRGYNADASFKVTDFEKNEDA